MSLTVHLNISVFPMVLLAVIWVSLRRQPIQTTDNRLFGVLVHATFLLLLLELLSWATDGRSMGGGRTLSWIANLVYFGFLPVVLLSWLNYVYFRQRREFLYTTLSPGKLLGALPLLLYYAALFSSPRTGWIFTVNAQNMYIRGSLFFLPNLLCSFYLLIALVMELRAAWASRSRSERRQNLRFALFVALPILAGVVQSLCSGIWIVLPSTAIAELLTYIYLQRLSIRKDALTGINNRGCLDAYLDSQLSPDARREPLCLFLLDLDHFKQINDSFGHSVGDDALIRAAAILAGSLHNTDAFLARYGGDEFCVAAHCATPEAAERMAGELKRAFTRAAAKPGQPYLLSCSVGYALADADARITPETLIQQADVMLYQDKKVRAGA